MRLDCCSRVRTVRNAVLGQCWLLDVTQDKPLIPVPGQLNVNCKEIREHQMQRTRLVYT